MMPDRSGRAYLQNRELSWLMFDRRVLEEAEDSAVPLLERLKFIAIFTGNLDEFFMVRVGCLDDMVLSEDQLIDNKTGMTIEKQLDAICRQTDILYREKDRIYIRVEMLLRQQGIAELTMAELNDGERAYVKAYFERMIRPLLSPQIIDLYRPFPHIESKVIHIIVRLKCGKKELFGMIPTAPSFPRVIKLPDGEMRYVLLENVLLYYADDIFEQYDVAERAVFCITRSTDLSLDDDINKDNSYLTYIKQMLRKRPYLAPVRLELGQAVSSVMLDYLLCGLKLNGNRVWISRSPLEMSYVMRIGSFIKNELRVRLSYPSFIPQSPDFCSREKSVIAAIEERDRLLCFPYHTFDVFVRLIQEASCDPSVISIKITVYRLSEEASKLITYLIKAAEAGKDVTVLMELKARFDEQNNIGWAVRLKEAGCRIQFGFRGIKVHSKLCLITRRCGEQIRYITQIGTGNYNEKTAETYTDVSLLTADIRIGRDAMKFFQNMGLGNLEGTYEHLIVAPDGLRRGLLSRIDDEIMRVRCGKQGRIIFKMNALTDAVIIEKLCEASAAGVRINLIVRGICCLLPKAEGKTENITVRSIVGRFLEHSRVYLFGTDESCDIYLSSADMMTRNTERRVEIACPVWDKQCKQTIIEMLELMLEDNYKARELTADGTYEKIVDDKEMIDYQAIMTELAARESGCEQDVQ